MQPLAEGKVYTGRQAQSIGLVDELGGLHEALTAAKKASGLAADEKINLWMLPKPQSFFEELFGDPLLDAQLSGSTLKNIPTSWIRYLAEAEILAKVFQHPVSALLPCVMTIK